jgi:hypothetical protein
MEALLLGLGRLADQAAVEPLHQMEELDQMLPLEQLWHQDLEAEADLQLPLQTQVMAETVAYTVGRVVEEGLV